MSGVAKRRLGCKCNCHDSGWGGSRCGSCIECIWNIRIERLHLKAIERQIEEALKQVSAATDFITAALTQFREVIAVEEAGVNVRVVVDMRMPNRFLPRHLERLQRLVKSRFGVGLAVAPGSDDQYHNDPNFERTPGVGPGRVPTRLGTPDGEG